MPETSIYSEENSVIMNQFSRHPLLSWGAVIAGIVTALSVAYLLSLLGIGIGLSVLDFEGNTQYTGLSIGAGIWTVVSILLALFAGGCVAGRLARVFATDVGLIHGTLVWAGTMIISLFLLGSAVGSLVNGASSVIHSTLSGAKNLTAAVTPDSMKGIDISQYLPENLLNRLQSEAQTIVNEAQEETSTSDQEVSEAASATVEDAKQGLKKVVLNPALFDDQLSAIYDNVRNRSENLLDGVDRDAIISTLAEETDLSRDQAAQAYDNWSAQIEKTYDSVVANLKDLKNEAVDAADKAAEATGEAALWSFVATLLGLIAACFGAIVGINRTRSVRDDLARA